MKRMFLNIALAITASLFQSLAFAYDFELKNEDGNLIFYTYISGGKELYASNRSSGWTERYGNGILRIPNQVTYKNRTRPVTQVSVISGNYPGDLVVVLPNHVDSVWLHQCTLSRLENYNYAWLHNCKIGYLYYKNDILSDNYSVNDVHESDINTCDTLVIGKDVKEYVYPKRGTYKMYNAKIYILEDLAAWCNMRFVHQDFSRPMIDNDSVFYNNKPIYPYLRLPKIKRINDYAFSTDKAKSIYIPNTIEYIGFNSFGSTDIYFDDVESFLKLQFHLKGGCFSNDLRNYYSHNKKLTEVVIPKGFKKIRDYAFYRGKSIQSVTIPEGIDSIGESSFAYSGIKTVKIPNGVKYIDYDAFAGSVHAVVLPSELPKMQPGAFYSGSLLTVVSLSTSPNNYFGSDRGSDVFSNDTYYNATLYVPKGTIEKYQNTPGWKRFVWIEEFDGTPEQIDEILAADIKRPHTRFAHKAYYNLNGVSQETLKKGINIIKMSDGTTKKVLVK